MKKLLTIIAVFLISAISVFAYFQIRVSGSTPAACYQNAIAAANAHCNDICVQQGASSGSANLDSCHTTGAMPNNNGGYSCGIYCSQCMCTSIIPV